MLLLCKEIPFDIYGVTLVSIIAPYYSWEFVSPKSTNPYLDDVPYTRDRQFFFFFRFKLSPGVLLIPINLQWACYILNSANSYTYQLIPILIPINLQSSWFILNSANVVQHLYLIILQNDKLATNITWWAVIRIEVVATKYLSMIWMQSFCY